MLHPRRKLMVAIGWDLKASMRACWMFISESTAEAVETHIGRRRRCHGDGSAGEQGVVRPTPDGGTELGSSATGPMWVWLQARGGSATQHFHPAFHQLLFLCMFPSILSQ